MSAIDERIVAMRFDNAQFEKGVRTSMRTLEDLKAASNLDDVAGNLSDFSKNFNKTLNFDGTTKDAGIFSKALTGLGKVAKKTFNASTFPLQALGRSLKSLGSYTRAMLGIDLASSLVNTGKTILRAFTIDPLRSGWSEYELKMDSIKTIMTGTVNTYKKMMEKKNPGFLYDEEKHLDYVKQGLEELNTYADKTIYSFQDMTSNIGKFTNAGVDFETAVDAIKGISNAAAHAGQGSSQASSAMYNLSQALGMGYLGMMDWRSIENANMATLTFKQTLIDLGTAMGKLKKAEDGLTYLVDNKGNIDKNTQVTAENLRETLQKKWVDKEVLLAALNVYSGEYSAEELKEVYKLTDDIAEALADIGKQAAKSATQVRTFTKMWDALKEAAQSGWAQTWELIFGDMNEATDFWTSLNDRFSGILDGMANGRNDLLKRWRGQGRYWNYSTGEWYWKQIPDAKDGRKILIDGLNDLLDVLQRLGGAIGTAWEKVFGVLTADKLVSLTEKFSGFTAKLKSWLGDANKDGTRLNKITKGFKGLFGILKGGGTLIKGAITTVANTLHLDKLIDLGINAFSGIGEWLTSVAGSIESVWNKIGQTEIAQKLSGFFSELWDSVSKFFGEVNPDTGKTGFAEWLESMTGRIAEIWDTFTKSDFFQNASNFFGDLFSSMTGFFTPKTITGKMGNSWTEKSDFQVMIDNVLGWFDGAWKTIEGKWTEFTNSDFYKNASSLFGDLWLSVTGFFTPKTITGKMGNSWTEKSDFQVMIDNVLGWFDGAWKTIEGKWTEFTNSDFYKNASSLFGDLWLSVTGFFTPKTITGKMGNSWTEKSDFQVMIDNVLGWFDGAWKTIEGKWTEFTNSDFYKNASSLFGDLWLSVTGFFTPKTITGKMGNSWTEKSDFQVMIDNVLGWFDGAWKTIEGKWTEFTNSDFYKNASSLFGDLWLSVTGFFTPKTITGKMGNSWTEKSDFQVMIDNVLGFFNDGWTTISNKWDEFKGTDFYTNASAFFSGLWDSVSGFFSSAFTVPEGGSWDDSPIGKAVHTVFGWIESAGAWLDENLGPIAEGVGKFLTDTWGWIMDKMGWSEQPKKAIQLPEGAKMVAFAAAADVMYDGNKGSQNAGQSTFLSFLTQVIDTISGFVTNVKEWNGWADVGAAFNIVFEGIRSIINTFIEATGITSLVEAASAVTSVFEAVAKIFGAISKVIISASDIITGKSDIDDWMTIIKTAAGILVYFLVKGGLTYISKGFTKADPSSVVAEIKGLIAFLGKVTIVIGWLGLLAIAIDGFVTLAESLYEGSGRNIDDIPKHLEQFRGMLDGVVSSISSAIGVLIGGTIGSAIGAGVGSYEEQRMKYIADGIKYLATAGKTIDDADIEHAGKIFDTLNILSKKLPEKPGVLASWFSNKVPMNLGDFGDYLHKLGEGFMDFNSAAMTIPDIDKVSRALDAIASLANAAANIALVIRLSDYEWYASDIIGEMFALVNNLDEGIYELQGLDVSPLISFADALNMDAIEASEKITFDPIVKKIVSEWESITAALSGGWTPEFFQTVFGISPPSSTPDNVVFDASNLDDMPLLSLQNGTLVLSGTVALDDSSISDITSAINNQGNAIRGAINGLSSKMDSVASAIRNMKLVLNTGVIAGAVDSVMGRSAVLYDRTGISGGQSSANYSNAMANGR